MCTRTDSTTPQDSRINRTYHFHVCWLHKRFFSLASTFKPNSHPHQKGKISSLDFLLRISPSTLVAVWQAPSGWRSKPIVLIRSLVTNFSTRIHLYAMQNGGWSGRGRYRKMKRPYRRVPKISLEVHSFIYIDGDGGKLNRRRGCPNPLNLYLTWRVAGRRGGIQMKLRILTSPNF